MPDPTDPFGRLDRLAALPDGWDGYAARPPDPAGLAAVRRFLTRLGGGHPAPPPVVVPLASGAIQPEWQVGDRGLELGFETPERAHSPRRCPPAGVADEDAYPAADFDRSVRLIRWVAAG